MDGPAGIGVRGRVGYSQRVMAFVSVSMWSVLRWWRTAIAVIGVAALLYALARVMDWWPATVFATAGALAVAFTLWLKPWEDEYGDIDC